MPPELINIGARPQNSTSSGLHLNDNFGSNQKTDFRASQAEEGRKVASRQSDLNLNSDPSKASQEAAKTGCAECSGGTCCKDKIISLVKEEGSELRAAENLKAQESESLKVIQEHKIGEPIDFSKGITAASLEALASQLASGPGLGSSQETSWQNQSQSAPAAQSSQVVSTDQSTPTPQQNTTTTNQQEPTAHSNAAQTTSANTAVSQDTAVSQSATVSQSVSSSHQATAPHSDSAQAVTGTVNHQQLSSSNQSNSAPLHTQVTTTHTSSSPASSYSESSRTASHAQVHTDPRPTQSRAESRSVAYTGRGQSARLTPSQRTAPGAAQAAGASRGVSKALSLSPTRAAIRRVSDPAASRETRSTGTRTTLVRDMSRAVRIANRLEVAGSRTISLKKAAALIGQVKNSAFYRNVLEKSKTFRSLLRDARYTIRASRDTRANRRLSQSFKRSLGLLMKKISSRMKQALRLLRRQSIERRVKLRARAARGGVVHRRSLQRRSALRPLKRLNARIRVRSAAERKLKAKSVPKSARSITKTTQKRVGVKTRPQVARKVSLKGVTAKKEQRIAKSEMRLAPKERRLLKRVESDIKALLELQHSILNGAQKSKSLSKKKSSGISETFANKKSIAKRKKRKSSNNEVAMDEGFLEEVEQILQQKDAGKGQENQMQAKPQQPKVEQAKMFVSAAQDGPKKELSTVQSKEEGGSTFEEDDSSEAVQYGNEDDRSRITNYH